MTLLKLVSLCLVLRFEFLISNLPLGLDPLRRLRSLDDLWLLGFLGLFGLLRFIQRPGELILEVVLVGLLDLHRQRELFVIFVPIEDGLEEFVGDRVSLGQQIVGLALADVVRAALEIVDFLSLV